MLQKYYLLVGLGGFLGSIVRGFAAKFIPFNAHSFSWATFSLNMLGSLFMGIILLNPNENIKAFWSIGFLGGLTTFSGLALELLNYFDSKQYALMAVYGISSLIIGFALIWLGQKLASF